MRMQYIKFTAGMYSIYKNTINLEYIDIFSISGQCVCMCVKMMKFGFDMLDSILMSLELQLYFVFHVSHQLCWAKGVNWFYNTKPLFSLISLKYKIRNDKSSDS